HAVIKKMRRALDESYANRLFLAEANQWPADVLAYFGDEDECHMAFHFPLMPRIFMALRLEDRHPITEIMAQTPPIPPSCQWGLFLRNHDELTLEMVTSDERDYMYLAYSADPRMRINVGIRRRLAPLMENNRRRIELLNSLLFSFPGTPVLYYGDEIGMGDNIYLGDRNGVRTPMQWTADRSAGFSRANPAKLYSPVILDPVYGYEAVNVEMQQSDPSSLLHWMRNMIGLRKLFQVFGRGTLDFLEPENRKVLAYLRRYANDQILCVANLSRFSQPVELDLSALAGMRPVEMLGFTEFPPIAKTPYRLTLGPYGFFWFELQGTAEPLDLGTAEGHLQLRRQPEELFENRLRRILESEVLPAFLPKQRWFGGKSRTIESAVVREWVPIRREPWAALVLVDVSYEGGGTEQYDLPLGVSSGRAAEELVETHPESIVARLRLGDDFAVLHDALAEDAACHALLEAIAARARWDGQHGVAEAFPVGEVGEVASLKVARIGSEQSNTSISFGGRWILKLFRRLQEGPNPDFEIGRFLTERVGFTSVPKAAGAIEYRTEEGASFTLAMLQQLVPNQGDGWTVALDELGRYYEHGSLHPAPTDEPSGGEIPTSAREAIGIYLDYAAMLGKRTAEMHLALATPVGDPAFEPEPVVRETLVHLGEQLRAHASQALRSLRAALPGLAEDSVDQAAQVLSRRAAIVSRFQPVEQPDLECALIRVHGDYHLGQVLQVENDFVIFDFEG
ncbi:MAG: alpha-glucosidase C-terminal domain-containing protein, partial [Deltaproteobacteria bacterium]|nr:alpha-glucosidase C-terminal domain-containing protein [Deltaproteobacteria bacterium]